MNVTPQISIEDFLSHCELCLVQKAIIKGNQFNRKQEAWLFALRLLHRCGMSALRVAERMCNHPEKADFVFDQYFYAEYKRKPFGGESTAILPGIQSVAMLRFDPQQAYR